MDLLRLVSFAVIIGYHYMKDIRLRYCDRIPEPEVIFHIGNVHLVMVSVSLFFMLSGAGLTLQMNRKTDSSVPSGILDRKVWKDYYLGRFSRILLPFYISYLLYLAYKLWAEGGNLFAGIPAWTFIFTLLGIDEYVYMTGLENFSLGIGEWFLGALILIYLIFPLLYLGLRKNKHAFLAVFTLYYLVMLINYHSGVEWYQNVFLKLYEFVLGMYLAAELDKILQNKKAALAAALAMLALSLGPIALPVHEAFFNLLACTGSFLLAACSEDALSARRQPGALLAWFGGYSFYVYLIHHAVIYTMNKAVYWHLVDYRIKRIPVLFVLELIVMLALAALISRICSRIRSLWGGI